MSSNNAGHWVEVKQDKQGEWIWVRIAANGEPLSKSSESYVDKAHAVEQAYQINADVSDIRYPDEP